MSAQSPATGPPADAGVLLLIPAFNEGASIGAVVREARAVLGPIPIVVLDDCSLDNTATEAMNAGAEVLSVPHHLGLGGCVQAGYRLAYQLGFRRVVRIDGDGQMDPRDVPRLLAALESSGCQMVIGSRFVDSDHDHTSFARSLGIRFFRIVLRPILGRPVRDPTSGFVAVNHEAIELFSKSFPLEYPEIEALVVLKRRAFQFVEVSCTFRPRLAGRSSITVARSFYYIVHVLLGVLVNILRFERHRWR
ncbi:MAG: glycosyltransferase family 2 protein [Bryobacteraceae bacterium]